MAATYYLVGVLLLAVAVSGQMQEMPALELEPAVLESNMDMEMLRPLMDVMVKNPYLCEVCEGVIEFLKNVTTDKVTLDELVQLLLPLCDWAPFNLHDKCIALIDNIPAEVEKYAGLYLDPAKVCAFLCKAPGMMMDKPNAIPLMTNIVQMMKARKPIN